jgi:hypothetical protein
VPGAQSEAGGGERGIVGSGRGRGSGDGEGWRWSNKTWQTLIPSTQRNWAPCAALLLFRRAEDGQSAL